LGKIDAPFFGVLRKQNEKKGGKRTPFFAVPSAGLVGLRVLWLCRALGFASCAVSALVSA
jgi:hypothetical protein